MPHGCEGESEEENWSMRRWSCSPSAGVALGQTFLVWLCACWLHVFLSDRLNPADPAYSWAQPCPQPWKIPLQWGAAPRRCRWVVSMEHQSPYREVRKVSWNLDGPSVVLSVMSHQGKDFTWQRRRGESGLTFRKRLWNWLPKIYILKKQQKEQTTTTNKNPIKPPPNQQKSSINALPGTYSQKMDVLGRKKSLHISSSSLLHDRITSFSLSSFCHQKAMKFKEMCSLYIIQCSFPVAYFVNSIFRGFEMMRRQGMASFH